MKIELEKKFNSVNLRKLINTTWFKSFSSKTVIFDLGKLEWISNSEVTFLSGWIRALSNKGILVSIQLQEGSNISLSSKEYKRRKHCLERLFEDWNFINLLPKGVKVLDGGISISKRIYNSLSEIIPIPLIEYNTHTFDHDFDQVYNNECEYLATSYRTLLKETDLNYYDTNFLNYSVLKELYSNVCIHADTKDFHECFFSIGLNRKFKKGSYEEYLSERRSDELTAMEKEFYIENGKYRNIDFIEINFQDFGVGIVNSLRDRYSKETEEILNSFFGNEFDQHKLQNEDSKILHYAILLFTSQFEIDRKFEIHDFIPRGLYIIQEIIEKYNGYFEIISYCGGIGISFKGGKKKISFIERDNADMLFPGTRIKLVFPSKEISDIKKNYQLINDSKQVLRSEKKIRVIHFLTVFSLVEKNIIERELKKDSRQLHIAIISNFFQTLLTTIQKIEKGGIVIIDFAGVDKNTVDLFNKFIYFISHSPINSTHGVILCNFLIKGLNSTIVFNDTRKLKSKGFTPYLVPVISYDRTVEWLGVGDKDIEDVFTKLWQGDTRKEYINENILNFSGSLIHVAKSSGQFKITINLPSFQTVCEEIDNIISEIVQSEIKNLGIEFDILKNKRKNYNNVLILKDNTYFLNSNGTYQLEYLSFNEKLYVRSYRKMIATYILYKLFHNNLIPLKGINKILSVTLSSQIIGNEVKEIMALSLNKPILLVALSNYYNFQNEEQFNDIKESDNVLVVNDVISTGSLTENIFQSIERKNANPRGCVSIVDLRTAESKDLGYPIIALTIAKVRRTSSKPEGVNIEWINPVLNTPVTMPQRKSNAVTLLTKEEFFKYVQEEHIYIGNMKNNSNYLNYFLDTSELLQVDSKSEYPLIKLLLANLRKRKSHAKYSEINDIIRGIDIISSNFQNDDEKKNLSKIKKGLEKLSSPTLFTDFKIDVVFYPFLSKISLIEDNMMPFADSFGNENLPLIFPIPRIMTSKGWRFSFPPKFMNILTQKTELSALIIDDGSSTGATIMQMIDSIAFLSVKSIDVVSIFGRLEDFQKELFSRVKSIKVENKVVPLNVFFGVHYHLPVYDSNENPFLFELKEIDQFERIFKANNIESEDNFEEFLRGMKAKLEDVRYPTELKEAYPIHLEISKKEMLNFRDRIGMFDSYRFYSDDVPANGNFDYFLSTDKSILTLLSVLNIEPRLYQTIKRIFPAEKIEYLRVKIFELMATNKYSNLEQTQLFLIKSLFHIDTRKFVNAEELTRLSVFIYKANFAANSYRYITYLLFLIGLKIRTINDVLVYKSFASNILGFAIDLKENNHLVHNKFRFFFESYRILTSIHIRSGDNLPANKYYKLSEYFSKVINNEKSHEEKLLPNHFNEIGKAIQQLIYSLNSKNEKEIEKDMVYFIQVLHTLRKLYLEEYNEYRIIKDIMYDLKNYSNNDLDFNPHNLYDLIIGFEKSLAIDNPDVEKLNRFSADIEAYLKNLLVSGSKFMNFILNQCSQIEVIWDKCEALYLKKDNYLKIEKKTSLMHQINVNPYILQLAFENLLKNKYEYSKNSKWEVFTNSNPDSLELYIKQYSAFIKDKGDGTGQQSIKSILYNFGTIYKKVNDNPYTIKIAFSK